MATVKLTEAAVKSFASPTVGQQLVYDSVLSGFGIRVSSGGTKSFFVERRLYGRTKRITLGPYPHLTVEAARKLGLQRLSELVQGIDRKALQEQAKLKSVTLGEAFEQFKGARKSLAARTLRDYDDLLNRLLSDWMSKPWIETSPALVLKRHKEIGTSNGPVTANHAMAAYRTVYRFAMKFYRDDQGKPLVHECPADILSDANAWFPQKPKETYIKVTQLNAWWTSVQALDNTTARDLLLLYVLTGLRPTEGRTLRWEDVDLQQRTISLSTTKNKKKHVIPISAYLLGLLTRRREAVSEDFVFPGEGETGSIVDLRKAIAKVSKQSGITFTPHDLRRTFSNCLEMSDVTYYAHKRLMNHTVGRDVTAKHYLSIDVERLRMPMERVTTFILKHAGVIPSSQIVTLRTEPEGQPNAQVAQV